MTYKHLNEEDYAQLVEDCNVAYKEIKNQGFPVWWNKRGIFFSDVTLDKKKFIIEKMIRVFIELEEYEKCAFLNENLKLALEIKPNTDTTGSDFYNWDSKESIGPTKN